MAVGEGQVADTAPHQRPPVTCPECLKDYDDPRKLAFHLERHREVLGPVYSPRGKSRSEPCPKGCGRHLPSSREYREHVPLCDGLAPITKEEARLRRERKDEREIAAVMEKQEKRESAARGRDQAVADAGHEERKEPTMAMQKCDECGKECSGGTGLSAHQRAAHGRKARSRKPGTRRRTPAAAPAKGASTTGDALRADAERCREQAQELEEKAEKLEEMAKQVEALL